MTNSVVSRIGQINASGADDALFLKQFGGEIFTEFEVTTVFKDKHFVRQIRNGKSAQFPLIGTVNSSYHTPGNFIDGQTVNHAETILTVDGLLVAPVFIASIDEMMNHYDVRQPYAQEMGRELAYTYDQNVSRVLVQAARASNSLTGRSGGSTVFHADMKTDSARLRAACFAAAQIMDEKNLSKERWFAIPPAQYYLMAQDTTLINKDYSGAGSIAAGTIETAAGLVLVKSNHLPLTNQSSDTSILAKYRGNYSTTVGVIWTRMAAGTVALQDIALEREYEIRRQGTFMVAKMAVGHGTLRPECAIEVGTADT